MKVALSHGFLGGKAGGGGGVRQMLELARGLKTNGHEVVLCVFQYEPGTIDSEIEENFEIRAVHTGKIVHPASYPAMMRVKYEGMYRLAKLMPKDIDVLNVHETPVYMAGPFAHRRTGAPVVWTRNDATLFELIRMPEESYLPPSSKLHDYAALAAGSADRFAGRRMDAICVLDQRNRRMVQRGYGRDAEVIQSGPAKRFFSAPSRADARAQLGIDPDEFAVLGVGILMPYRRHEDIVRAIGEMSEGDRPVRLRLIGSDHLSPDTGVKLRGIIDQSGIADRVQLIQEAVPEDELLAHFAAADAFVFANELQTWGLAPLEAIASGTPAIVSRGAGVHEVLEGRSSVQLVDPRSPDQIAAALERIRTNPAEFDTSETRDWIAKELSSEAYAGRMADLFKRLS